MSQTPWNIVSRRVLGSVFSTESEYWEFVFVTWPIVCEKTLDPDKGAALSLLVSTVVAKDRLQCIGINDSQYKQEKLLIRQHFCWRTSMN